MTRRLRLTDLVPRLLADDPIALEQFVDGALHSLLGLAVGRWRVLPQDAEELALAAITATLQHLETLRLDDQPEGDPLFSYLAKALRNGILVRQREQQREVNALGRLMNSEPS